jgi:hypothetical protein
MDIEVLIPNKDNNWICRNNVLYYKKFALIPLASKIDGELYINLDSRCIKPLLKLLNHCINKEINFLFCDKFTITEKHIWNEHIDGIIANNLCIIEEPKIFKLIKSNNLDYLNIFCKFLRLYECHNRFIKVYSELKRDHFSASWFDWYDHKMHYRVNDVEVREYYESLFREMKILLLFFED